MKLKVEYNSVISAIAATFTSEATYNEAYALNVDALTLCEAIATYDPFARQEIELLPISIV